MLTYQQNTIEKSFFKIVSMLFYISLRLYKINIYYLVMKIRKNMGLPLIVAIAFVLNSCGLSSMISKFESIDYTITPTEVEVHGGKVTIELDVTVPEKYFNKSATMSFTPKLIWEGGEGISNLLHYKEKKFQAMELQ